MVSYILMFAVVIFICGSLSGKAASFDSGFTPALSSAKWLVRDVAEGSRFTAPDATGRVKRLKLKIERRDDLKSHVWTSSCKVTSETPADRAITLSLSIPLDMRKGLWWDDPQRARPISGKKSFANLVTDMGVGATGSSSRYPLAVVSLGDKALCLAVPVEQPRLVTFTYDSEKCELRADFDFGLSNVPVHFPLSADATVIAFEIPAKWAFRQALARYYELYPTAFARRVKKVGTWLPFSEVTTIDRPEDFGIEIHELGVENLEWAKEDEKYGVDSYLYTEPQTNWRDFRGEEKNTYVNWISQLWEDALKGDVKAQATLSSGIECADGRRDIYLGPVTFTKSAPFGVNCDPEVPTEEWGTWPNKSQYEMGILEKALGWIDGKKTNADGIYIDSMEGWGQIKNYNRSHWRTSHYPLTFDSTTYKLCLLNFWGNYAFIKMASEKLHAKGQCLMGNDAYFRFWHLAPYVDIPGREYRWYDKDNWTPVSDENYLFLRSMSASKPYLMLMNNDYNDAKNMEEYFQRSLFYAVYPSMFHGHSKIGETAYFCNPEWYNRDRPLFLKYLPMIRKLDKAGWRPVPYAEIEPKTVRYERYGDYDSGTLAFTLHNTSSKTIDIKVSLRAKELGLPPQVKAIEWISGKSLSSVDGQRFIAELPANGYAVIGISR